MNNKFEFSFKIQILKRLILQRKLSTSLCCNSNLNYYLLKNTDYQLDLHSEYNIIPNTIKLTPKRVELSSLKQQ